MARALYERFGFLIELDNKKALSDMQRMEKAFNRLKKVVIAVIAGKIVKDMANFGKELSLMADRTGMSIQKLSSLRNVFLSAGSGAKGFQSTIEKINQGILGLNRGEGQLAAALAPMGISPFGKDAKQILLEASDWAKNQLSMGRSKEQVIDYLTSVLGIDPTMARDMLKGSTYLLSEEERLRGKVGEASKENVKNLEAFNKSLNELGAAWENAKVNVLGQILPIIQPIIDGLAQILAWAGEHPVIAAAAVALWEVFGVLGKIAMLKFGASLLGLGGAAAGAGAGAGAAAGVGAAAAAAGTVALGAALAAVIGDAIMEIIDFWQTGKLDGPIAKFWEWVFDAFGTVWDASKSFLQKTGDWIGDKWDKFKNWAVDVYANSRADMGTAYTPTTLGQDLLKEEAWEKTKKFFENPDELSQVVFTEPFIGDLSRYFNGDERSGGMSIVNHFEGSTFGTELAETEEAVTNAMSTVMSNSVPAM